jgi:hypothetical protein
MSNYIGINRMCEGLVTSEMVHASTVLQERFLTNFMAKKKKQTFLSICWLLFGQNILCLSGDRLFFTVFKKTHH